MLASSHDSSQCCPASLHTHRPRLAHPLPPIPVRGSVRGCGWQRPGAPRPAVQDLGQGLGGVSPGWGLNPRERSGLTHGLLSPWGKKQDTYKRVPALCPRPLPHVARTLG